MIAEEICNILLIKDVSLFIETISNNYKNFMPLVLNKGTDKERLVFRPKKFTKACQKIILEKYLSELKCSDCVFSYKKNSSIVDNAKAHVGNKYFLHLDIKHFFNRMVWNKFIGIIHKNFENSNLDKLMLNKEDNEFLRNVLTFNGFIVQGSVTSPYISNLYLIELDEYIQNKILSSVPNGVYTRYSDDIYISSSQYIKHEIIDLIGKKLKEYGLKFNYSKIDYKKLKDSVKITGVSLLPNRKITTSNKYKKELKRLIYLCIKNEGRNTNFDVLLGKYSYLKSVDPKYYEFLQNKYKQDDLDTLSYLRKLKSKIESTNNVAK